MNVLECGVRWESKRNGGRKNLSNGGWESNNKGGRKSKN